MDTDNRDLAAPKSDGRSTSLRPFFRLLKYVWRQKRYLIPSIICILFMAVSYSASLGSILPIMTVLIRSQGLHGAVDQYVAENRLKCELGIYDPLRDREVKGIPTGTLRLRTLSVKSPLRSAGLQQDDFILVANNQSGKAVEVLSALAGGDTLTLRFRGPEKDAPERVGTVTLPASKFYQLGYYHPFLRRIVARIPGGLEPMQRLRTLLMVLGGLGVVVLVGNVARFCAEYLTVIVNCRAIMDLRRQLYRQVLKLPLSYFSRNTTDTLSRFAQDTNEIFRGLSNFFEKIVTEPFKALGAAIIALLVDPQLTVVVLVATGVCVLVIRKLGKKIRRASKKVLKSYSLMLQALESTLTGIRVVKAYAGEHYERKRLFRIDRSVLSYQLKMGRTEALASPFLEMLGFLAVALAILYFGYHILTHGAEEELGKFVTIMVALGAVFDPIRKLTTVYPKIQRASAAAERVFEIIDSPNEYTGDTGRPRLKPMAKTIEFVNVGYTYPESNRPALRDISLTVRKGEIVALVGPNGCGKTTLVSLLPRFFPLTQGQILIDGQDINEVSLRSLREQFSLITQESVIFPDSINANIAYGLPHADPEAIKAAARKAFADEFIGQMPNGYETVVGEHGATLSGGQRQRLSIARAILRDAPILIFDEATAQVDPESEMKIHKALDSFLEDRTAFVIAHRYSTVRNADRIVVMDDGNIMAVGTHDELLKSCPLYGRLYEAQFRSAGVTAEETAQALAVAGSGE